MRKPQKATFQLKSYTQCRENIRLTFKICLCVACVRVSLSQAVFSFCRSAANILEVANQKQNQWLFKYTTDTHKRLAYLLLGLIEHFTPNDWVTLVVVAVADVVLKSCSNAYIVRIV